MLLKRLKFRELLAQDDIVMVPGAYDALTAKLIEQAGFSALYITGAGVAVTKLGLPDIGLVTMSELLDTAKNIVNAVDIPVICDIDTGFGNSLNLIRTVREFESIGITAVQVEDQITPKKCGHLEGKQLISEDEMIRKIKAFNYARGSTDFLLIARTDALAVYGLNDAIERAKSYREAGADIIFVESPRNKKDLEKISVQLSGIILMVNLVEGGGKTPILPLKELRDMGYRIVIYPITPLLASIKSIQRNLAVLKAHGNTSVEKLNMSTLTEMFDLVGMQFYKSLDNYF
jgi:2-methylisocitrate lyase-like PEP mutase family enzyme